MDKLENIKVGDKLFIENRNVGIRFDYVVEITKAGNIKTERCGIFNRRGELRGESSSWNFTRARLATDADIAAVRRTRKLRAVRAFNFWDKLPDADLDTVLSIMEKVHPPVKA